MIDAERNKFDEIKVRFEQGTISRDDIDWLATELDSYSKAWKTERDNLRKLVEINQKYQTRQERLIGVLKLLADRLRNTNEGAFEYELRMAEQAAADR
jgi:hypothetical protein